MGCKFGFVETPQGKQRWDLLILERLGKERVLMGGSFTKKQAKGRILDPGDNGILQNS